MSVALSTVHPFPAATGPHPPVVVTVTLTVPGGPLVADVARRLADRVRTLATEASAAVDLHARVETTVTAVLDQPPSTVAAGLRPEAPPRLAAAPELALLPDRRIALLDGGPLALTRREYDLLLFLVENASRAYTRAQLLRQVWGYDYLDGTRTVDVHVRRLRAKLHGRGPKITTVRGTGYRLDRVQLAAVIGD